MAINRVLAWKKLKICVSTWSRVDARWKVDFFLFEKAAKCWRFAIILIIPFIAFHFVALAKIPVRLNVGVMLFMASFVSYMLRVNFSIIIIAMTKKISPNVTIGNLSENGNAHQDDSFNWSKTDQGLLLSAYFYGYIFPNLLGGMLAGQFGGRIVIFTGMFLSSVVTGLSPLTASDNFIFMFASRFILGVLGVRYSERLG